LPHRRFYFFFIELWPQEVYYFTGRLIIAAMTLFLMNAVAGRVWCGYMCPQTIWTDLFYAVERFVEGDRRERILSDKRGWTLTHIRQAVTRHFIWLMIAWWTGGAWVLYFNDAPTLVKQLVTFQAPMLAYIWIGILTATTYVLAGFMRVLTQAFVEHYRGRLLNIHPSLLPDLPGMDTHRRALDSGRSVHGASVHFVTPEVDGGPVIVQARIAIAPDDDAATLRARVLAAEHKIYPLAVRWYARRTFATDQ